MSIDTFDEALDFMPAQQPGLATRALRAVRLVAGAMADGQAASIRYSELKARGLDHPAAARAVLAEHFGGR